jgi:hypothetical protein
LKPSEKYSFSSLGIKAAEHRFKIWKQTQTELRNARKKTAAGEKTSSKKTIAKLERRLRHNPIKEILGMLEKEGTSVERWDLKRELDNFDRSDEAMLLATTKRLRGWWEYKRRKEFVATRKWTSDKTSLRELGFETERPCPGLRRADPSEVPEDAQLTSQLHDIANRDPKLKDHVKKQFEAHLKRTTRNLWVTQDPAVAPLIKKAVDRLIDGWEHKPAFRKAKLPTSIATKLRSLLRNSSGIRSKLWGEIPIADPKKDPHTRYVRMRIIGDPILDPDKGHRLERSLPPPTWKGRLAFGFCWRDGKKQPHPEEAPMIETTYKILDQLGDINKVSHATGFSRDQLCTMFGNRDTALIVGYQRWNQTYDRLKDQINNRHLRREKHAQGPASR